MTYRSRSRLDLWKIVHSFRNEFFTCLFKIQNVQVIQNDVIKCCKMMSSNVAKWCHHIATSQQHGEIVFHVVILLCISGYRFSSLLLKEINNVNLSIEIESVGIAVDVKSRLPWFNSQKMLFKAGGILTIWDTFTSKENSISWEVPVYVKEGVREQKVFNKLCPHWNSEPTSEQLLHSTSEGSVKYQILFLYDFINSIRNHSYNYFGPSNACLKWRSELLASNRHLLKLM